MDSQQALQLAQSGKKVRKTKWLDGKSIYFEGGSLRGDVNWLFLDEDGAWEMAEELPYPVYQFAVNNGDNQIWSVIPGYFKDENEATLSLGLISSNTRVRKMEFTKIMNTEIKKNYTSPGIFRWER